MTRTFDRTRPFAAVAPCSPWDEGRVHQAITMAEQVGFRVEILAPQQRRHRYLAGEDKARAHELRTALSDPRWGGVWALRGGYGMTRILPFLDGLRPQQPLLGFSDVTPLLHQLAAPSMPAWHGPVLNQLPDLDDDSLQALWEVLDGRMQGHLPGTMVQGGPAVGPLVGGNLCLLAATVGTPAQVDARGAIVCIEEVGEPTYRLDRMLTQLLEARFFAGAVGIALGTWHGCSSRSQDHSVIEVVLERLTPLGLPIAMDLGFGHGPQNAPWPVGGRGHLQADGLVWACQSPPPT
ncbi:MAG: S66 peptidase family protein [Myxococcota bacterium]